MGALRILIAEESLALRRRLAAAFVSDPACTVVGEAGEGAQAFSLCQRLRPDVVALGLRLPGLNGVEVTQRIMAHCPTPIIVFCEAAPGGSGPRLLDALGAGAVDVVNRPSQLAPAAWEGELVSRTKLAARVKACHRVIERLASAPPAPLLAPRVVAVGASTGGPAAVKDILERLAPGFPLPIVLVMHLAGSFEASMLEWLGRGACMPVRRVVDGEPLPIRGRPVLLLAPAHRHLVVRDGRLRLVEGPERHSSRPSVDVFFESLASELGARAIGCLLTGMGRDGAEGLAALRRAGAMTMAQDEASSVIFGMPREAIRLGAARHVVALRDIPRWLEGAVHQRWPAEHA